MTQTAKIAPKASLEPETTPTPTPPPKEAKVAKSKRKDEIPYPCNPLKIDWDKANHIISQPFPDEAIQANSERTGTEEVGIKPQYIFERLNQAFGEHGWRTIETKQDIGQNFVYMKIELQVGHWEQTVDIVNGAIWNNFMVEASREAYGGSRLVRGNLPDALKGAQTDAIKKAASMFNVAGDAYKGLITVEEAKEKEAKAKGIPYSPQPKGQVAPTCPKCKATMNWRNSKRGPFWGCSNYPACKELVDVKDVNIDGSLKANNGENFEESPY